jgi:hypothetical protein
MRAKALCDVPRLCDSLFPIAACIFVITVVVLALTGQLLT